MAKGKKTGGRDIKPGEVRNPHGRPKLPEHVKKAKRLNKGRFIEILNEHIMSTAPQLKSKIDDPSTPALELCVIKILFEAIKGGDHKRFEFILDRLIGKVPISVDDKSEIKIIIDADDADV